MKKIFVIFISLLQFLSYAQNSNLVFFTMDAKPFYVVLNGVRQNAKPETNVKITGLKQPYYKVKIIFNEPGLNEINKNITFNPNTETIYNIKKNKKGEYVLRYYSEVPINQAPPSTPNQSVVVYTLTPPPVHSTTTITETSTTVSSSGNQDLNAGGMGLINDGNNQTSTSSTTTTTTTSTTIVHHDKIPATPVETYTLPGYNGPVGCPVPMNNSDFYRVKESISSKDFEDSKLTIAKQVISANCLLTSQIKEIMQLFSFEDTRLELAKFAYGHTYDIGNYYQLNDAFEFETSIDELNEYISNQH